MPRSSFPLLPDTGSKLITCSVSLPVSVRDDLVDVATYIEVSRSSLMSCILAPTLREFSDLITSKPEIIEQVLSAADGVHQTRLRGEAGRNVEHKVWLLNTLLAKSKA